MTYRYLLALLLLLPAGALAEGPSSPIGVEALIDNVAEHKGALRVRGIVGKTAREKQLFSLVDLSDREELLRTGKTQCVTLPVRWAKEMPAPHSVVVVNGEVQETAGRLVFVAESLTTEPETASSGVPEKRP